MITSPAPDQPLHTRSAVLHQRTCTGITHGSSWRKISLP